MVNAFGGWHWMPINRQQNENENQEGKGGVGIHGEHSSKKNRNIIVLLILIAIFAAVINELTQSEAPKLPEIPIEEPPFKIPVPENETPYSNATCCYVSLHLSILICLCVFACVCDSVFREKNLNKKK